MADYHDGNPPALAVPALPDRPRSTHPPRILMLYGSLRERSYSAVMAATGLLYLAILTAFGMDLVARAALAG